MEGFYNYFYHIRKRGGGGGQPPVRYDIFLNCKIYKGIS